MSASRPTSSLPTMRGGSPGLPELSSGRCGISQCLRSSPGTGGRPQLPSLMKTRKPIEICITVDTEFSIGGNFDNPELLPVSHPIVLGAVAGKEHGLGFLLDSLAEFALPAT